MLSNGCSFADGLPFEIRNSCFFICTKEPDWQITVCSHHCQGNMLKFKLSFNICTNVIHSSPFFTTMMFSNLADQAANCHPGLVVSSPQMCVLQIARNEERSIPVNAAKLVIIATISFAGSTLTRIGVSNSVEVRFLWRGIQPVCQKRARVGLHRQK